MNRSEYSQLAVDRVAVAQRAIALHIESLVGERCTACGHPSPCAFRRAAEGTLRAYGQLPHRVPGATLRALGLRVGPAGWRLVDIAARQAHPASTPETEPQPQPHTQPVSLPETEPQPQKQPHMHPVGTPETQPQPQPQAHAEIVATPQTGTAPTVRAVGRWPVNPGAANPPGPRSDPPPPQDRRRARLPNRPQWPAQGAGSGASPPAAAGGNGHRPRSVPVQRSGS